MTTPDDSFYGGIKVFRGFGSLRAPALYSPLPDDWSIGIADIVESTRAIAEARYKAVNMAGASVIAAVTNALEGREFPFVFGGDGAHFAVSKSPPGTQPDLSGLSCRFEEIPSTRGLILSVLVVPASGADPLAFRQ